MSAQGQAPTQHLAPTAFQEYAIDHHMSWCEWTAVRYSRAVWLAAEAYVMIRGVNCDVVLNTELRNDNEVVRTWFSLLC
eukprot:m.67160 g.67160  ORF g.67160 m.67160 type:complete len:79 (+) comp12158_c0_seq2:471-707(+)